MYRRYPLYFCLFIFFFVRSQDDGDSLRQLIFKAASDTQKVNAINAFSRRFLVVGDFDSAFVHTKRSHELASSVGYKRGMAISYLYYGLIYCARGNYPEALKNYYASLKLREEMKDRAGVAAIYHNIGNLYFQQRNEEEAMKNFLLSLNIKRETGDTLDSHYAHTINNLGNFYENRVNYPEAMQYYRRAAAIEQRIGDVQGLISAYANMSNVYINLGEYEKAFSNYFLIMRLCDSTGDKLNQAAIYNDLGNLYYKVGKPKEAIPWLDKGILLSIEIGSMDDVKTGYGYRTEVHEALGNYTQSLHDYKMWVAYKDSLTNEENTRKQVRSEMNYEFEKKEAAAKLEQEKREAIAKADSRRQWIIMYSVCGILVLVFAFAVYAYRSYLQKRKANLEITRQKEIIEVKQKEILDSIHYAKNIQTALLSSDQYIEKQLIRLKGKK